MRVLVTRPQPAASRTAEKLRAMGHEPVVLPLSAAVPDPDAARTALAGPHAAIALTSAQAAAVMADIGNGHARHRATVLFAVGEATARAARSIGFDRVIIGPGDGHGLAETIVAAWPTLSGGEPAPLLYLAGQPRSPVFEQVLARHAIPVLAVDCYRMVPIDAQAALEAILTAADAPTAMLVYSAESARLLRRMSGVIPRPLWPQATFCLSRVVADALADVPGRIGTAARPDEDSLLALLAAER